MKNFTFEKDNLISYFMTLIVVLLSTILIYNSINLTIAWFYESKYTSKIEVIGTIDLTVVTNFTFDNNILIPCTTYSNKPTTIAVSSTNNIGNAFVKVKFESNSDQVELYGVSSDWVYNDNALDPCYYYIGLVNTTPITFNTGYVVGGNFTNNDVGFGVVVTFTVYGLQSEYGAYAYEWPDAPTEFNTYASGV